MSASIALMKIYRIHRRQWLPIDLDTAWDYFWTPRNLEAMTPSFLRFRITSPLPQRIYAGLIITYRISAVAGIPMTWVTEITHVDEPRSFVDEQRIGPFRLWHHRHGFRAVDGGIEMEDTVHYVMPWGCLGRLVHRAFISRRLERIFDFRAGFLAARFGTHPAAPGSDD